MEIIGWIGAIAIVIWLLTQVRENGLLAVGGGIILLILCMLFL